MSNQPAQSQSAGIAKQMTQGEAVVQAVRDVLKTEYKENAKVVLNDDQRKAVTELLVKGFMERRIPLKASPTNEAKLADPAKLNAYVKGLINNWLQKSPMLNGKPKKTKTTPPSTSTLAASTSAAASDTKTGGVEVTRPEVKVSEAIASGKEAVVAAIGSKKPTPPAGKK